MGAHREEDGILEREHVDVGSMQRYQMQKHWVQDGDPIMTTSVENGWTKEFGGMWARSGSPW